MKYSLIRTGSEKIEKKNEKSKPVFGILRPVYFEQICNKSRKTKKRIKLGSWGRWGEGRQVMMGDIEKIIQKADQ